MLNEMVSDSWILGNIYAHLALEVGMRDLNNSLHISYLYIENFWLQKDLESKS